MGKTKNKVYSDSLMERCQCELVRHVFLKKITSLFDQKKYKKFKIFFFKFIENN